MVDAQEWLDKNYPKNGTCQRHEDKKNYGKKRNEIVKLDFSEIGLLERLEGNLDLSSFPNLQELDCHNNKITNLDVSKNEYLTNLTCDNDQHITPGLIRSLEDLIKEKENKLELSKEELGLGGEEKESLQKLIIANLEFTNAKKRGLPDISTKYREPFEKLYEELEDKFNEKQMQKIEIILVNQEKLVGWKLELETKQSYQVNIKFPQQDVKLQVYGGIAATLRDPIAWIHKSNSENTNFTSQTQIFPK